MHVALCVGDTDAQINDAVQLHLKTYDISET